MSRRISPKKFVEVWQTSSNTAEAAQRLNMKKPAVATRAAQYRRKGIPLKKYNRGASALDIPSLAEYARSLEEQSNATETIRQELPERIRPGSFRPEGEEGEGSEE